MKTTLDPGGFVSFASGPMTRTYEIHAGFLPLLRNPPFPFPVVTGSHPKLLKEASLPASTVAQTDN